MTQATVTNTAELPVLLNMKHIQEITGLSRPECYKLPHMKGFPVIRFGKAIRVPRDRFLAWLDEQASGVAE